MRKIHTCRSLIVILLFYFIISFEIKWKPCVSTNLDGLQIMTFLETKIFLRIQSSLWYTVKHQFGV